MTESILEKIQYTVTRSGGSLLLSFDCTEMEFDLDQPALEWVTAQLHRGFLVAGKRYKLTVTDSDGSGLIKIQDETGTYMYGSGQMLPLAHPNGPAP